jgi:hypothetical protein
MKLLFIRCSIGFFLSRLLRFNLLFLFALAGARLVFWRAAPWNVPAPCGILLIMTVRVLRMGISTRERDTVVPPPLFFFQNSVWCGEERAARLS